MTTPPRYDTSLLAKEIASKADVILREWEGNLARIEEEQAQVVARYRQTPEGLLILQVNRVGSPESEWRDARSDDLFMNGSVLGPAPCSYVTGRLLDMECIPHRSRDIACGGGRCNPLAACRT